MESDIRIDKYLWAIRAFKTRSEAADACKGGKVRVGEDIAKPSREVKVGDVINVRRGAVTLSWRVKHLLHNRVGASLVADYAEDITPEEERAKLDAPRENIFLHRDRGTGRPTKKDRRTLEKLISGFDLSD